MTGDQGVKRKTCREVGRLWRFVPILLLAGILPACTSSPPITPVQPAPDYAIPPGDDGAFAAIEAEIRAGHGNGVSGFKLVDRNEDGLRWRLALIDAARHSIDLQYYLWYGDAAGQLLAQRIFASADRGVKVRMLVDDLNTLLQDAGSVALRDRAVAWMDAHPNLEVRLFNPWTNREIAGRVVEGLGDLPRLNKRMHNKAMVVDNQATILGGRNIGDEYMGLNAAFNFHDLDVLGIGPVARQASTVFDAYWNSEWVLPVSALGIELSPEEIAAARVELAARLERTASLAQIPLAPQSPAEALSLLPAMAYFGESEVHSDLPRGDAIDHVMLERIRSMMAETRRELLIVNAYIIPVDYGIERLRAINGAGGESRILTNSLASHDVPAVNSHYKQWRKPIIETGAELYEMRHDPRMQSAVCDTAPTRAAFCGLHSKAMVVDRERVYIGSMNYDPRSAIHNTEMGVFIDSPGLAAALAQLMHRGMEPANSWRVEQDERGRLIWSSDAGTEYRQPARNAWQRVEDFFFRAFPKSLY